MMMCIFYFNQQKIQQSERKKNALFFLNGQIKERKEIAQNLHDCLSLQIFRLQRFLQTNQNHPHQQILLEDVQNLSINMRRISHSLHPISLEKNGLIHAIEEEIYKIELTNEDIDIHFENNLTTSLNKSHSEILFYSALELIRNALLHSNCSRLSIQLIEEGTKIKLIISDNGVGYDASKIGKGMGIANIEARVKLIEGTFRIRSNEEGGTSHLIVI